VSGTRAERPLRVVVGSGGVGKTTLAAALGLEAAQAGHDTLVMTFDPSRRLKDALGVGAAPGDREVRVPVDCKGTLDASLLDARATFDRLVGRYAPDEASRRRILGNRYYAHLAGRLAGVLEYMAVERLYEVARSDRYERVVLDTPPTRQALDFLEAPDRIVAFLDSGALRIALRPWFDERGHLRGASRLGALGRGFEAWLDRLVGLGLLRDMAEFFQAFGPLYEGFRRRALEVRELLRSPRTSFVLVAGPGEDTVPETLFFARRLEEAGYRLEALAVNRVHGSVPAVAARGGESAAAAEARRLLHWLGERDRRGVARLRELLPGREPWVVPLAPEPPDDLAALGRFSRVLADARESASRATRRAGTGTGAG
jgi:anion-transporting  ArsA/GET3 family ATPase